MRERFGLHQYSLTVQMVLSFMVLVILTAVATGLPEVFLIRNQIQRQAWAQVDQGSRTTQALYAAWQDKVTGLAVLTSQRPTLTDLLAGKGEEAPLTEYLQTLKHDAELDLLVACDESQSIVAQAGQITGVDLCAIQDMDSFYVLTADQVEHVWFLASHPIGDETIQLGKVIAGAVLDNEFAIQLREQTGLEHRLLVDGRQVAGSLPSAGTGQATDVRHLTTVPVTGINQPMTYKVDDLPYYAAHIPLNSLGLVNGFDLTDEVALVVTDIVTTERQLVLLLSASVVAIALVVSILGVFVARRIGRPLAQLADAAATFSEGNLDQPVSVQGEVREVRQVAQALEQARIELRRTISELRQANAWSERLMDAIAEGIVTLDNRNHITFFSPGAEHITGLSQEAATGRDCDEVFILAESDSPFSQHLPPVGKRSKILLLMEDGRQVTLAMTGAQLAPPAADESGVALVLRDVSETETMHRLVGEFLANITHEFRTPLSALAASAELLLDQAPSLSRAELQELLAALHLSILRLQTLIDNLLESARVEAGRFSVNPQPADLGQMIADATRIMQPLQDKYNQRLVLELPATIPTVQADSRRTAQVLVNLLSNAIKYSPDNTEITIRVTVLDNWARVAVADQGPGVPEGYRPDLFRPFTHPTGPDNQSRHGAGLGLSVAKSIVEAHGGQVGAEDRPGGGSVFWFTLPLVEN
jgi:two-component system phosphate regulon sensor histidine kinase PhoR